MFGYCMLLTVLLCVTDYAFACFNIEGPPREYSESEKNWCRQDLYRCAQALCWENSYPCNHNTINIEIIPKLRCNLYNQCQPRTDKLGYACYRNKDCENSNYRCFRGRCEHKVTVSVAPRRSCYLDAECPNNSYRCTNGQCVLKSGGSIGECEASPDCPKGYKCVGFRCVPGAGSRPRPTPRPNIPTTCEASPDCAKGYKCVGFKCVPGSGRGGRGKYCEEFDTECGTLKMRCDRVNHVCVPV